MSKNNSDETAHETKSNFRRIYTYLNADHQKIKITYSNLKDLKTRISNIELTLSSFAKLFG